MRRSATARAGSPPDLQPAQLHADRRQLGSYAFGPTSPIARMAAITGLRTRGWRGWGCAVESATVGPSTTFDTGVVTVHPRRTGRVAFGARRSPSHNHSLTKSDRRAMASVGHFDGRDG